MGSWWGGFGPGGGTLAAVLTTGADSGGVHYTDPDTGLPETYKNDESGNAADATVGGMAVADGAHNAYAIDAAEAKGSGFAAGGVQSLSGPAGTGPASAGIGATVENAASTAGVTAGTDATNLGTGPTQAWIRSTGIGSAGQQVEVFAFADSHNGPGAGETIAKQEILTPLGRLGWFVHSAPSPALPELNVSFDDRPRGGVTAGQFPLLSSGAGPPAGPFQSLLYRDTTPGSLYIWDFLADAYVVLVTAA